MMIASGVHIAVNQALADALRDEEESNYEVQLREVSSAL
jgi:hypothetical protein